MDFNNLEISKIIDIGQYVQCDFCDTVYRTEDGTTLNPDQQEGG